MITLVALDMAGTTVDEGGAVYGALAGAVLDDELHRGSSLSDAQVQKWMGAEKRTAIAALSRLASGRDPDASAVDRMYDSFRARLRAAYAASPPRPFPGTAETFAELRRRGVKVALTTGFARDVADPLLAGLGWSVGGSEATVDAVVCGDEVPLGRPAPYLIFRAMERTLTTSVHEVLVAGDTVSDVQSGTNAGAREVVGVTTGKLTREELAAERPTHVVASVAEIPRLLGVG